MAAIQSSASETSLVCPITLEVMRDPVVAADGHTYERDAILKWFRSGSSKSPSTGALLASTTLLPNHRLRAIIDESGLSPSNSSSSLLGSGSSSFLPRMGVRRISSFAASQTSTSSPFGSSESDDASVSAHGSQEGRQPLSSTASSTALGNAADDVLFPQLQPHLRELLRTTRFFDEYLEQRSQLESLLLFIHDAQMPLPAPLRTESMLLRLSSALLSSSRPKEARVVLEQAIALPGASYVPRIWLCVSHVINGDFDVAVELLRQLLVEVPEASPEYALLQGLLETATENGERATERYAEGIVKGHDAHRRLAMDSPSASDPSLRHYRTENLAWLYHLYSAETRDDAQALESIVAAQQLGFPRKVTLFRNMALTLMRLGRYDEALANINWSLELNGEEPLSWEHKANILKRLGRESEAVECWTRVIQLKPGCAEPLVTRATVWQDPHRGIQDCLRALQIDPDSLYAKAMLIALFLDTKQFFEARDFASRFIETRPLPSDARLTPNDVHIRRGRMHARLFLGDFEGAIDDFDDLSRRGVISADVVAEQRKVLTILRDLFRPESPLDAAGKAALRVVLTTASQGLWMTSIPDTMEFSDEATGVAIGLVFVLAKQHFELEALSEELTRLKTFIKSMLASEPSKRIRVRAMLVRLSPLFL